jgi:hypothetical protein
LPKKLVAFAIIGQLLAIDTRTAGSLGPLFLYVSIEEWISASHPLGRKLADQALDRLNANFSELYDSAGQPSVPPASTLAEYSIHTF